jgi:uncharacterized protein (DUF1330 family)
MEGNAEVARAMTVFVIAQLTFTDRTAYDRYQARFMDTFAGSGGRLLAADEAPVVIEGQWPHQKVVLLSFPDRQTCLRWQDSDAYREIAVDRRAGAAGPVVMVSGI